MKVLVKRENWDGGIWLNLPVTEEEAKQMYEQLKQIHPSAGILNCSIPSQKGLKDGGV